MSMRGPLLPSPNRRQYDPDNEAQMRRVLELRLRDMQTQLDALTDPNAARLYLELDGGSIATTYDDYTDGGSLADRPAITYDAGVID